MCIAILNQQSLLPKETLQKCWTNNDDGAGLACIYRGKLHLYKEISNFEAFYAHYQEMRSKAKKSKFLIHFRIATQGEKTTLNCHPFQVSDKLAFIHNGMLKDMPYNVKFSDTSLFNSLVLSKFPDGFEKNADFQDTMKIFTGTGSNKLVFLNVENQHFIVNENLGHWKDGDWFSNSSYSTCAYPSYYKKNSYIEKEECLYCGEPSWNLVASKCFDCRKGEKVLGRVLLPETTQKCAVCASTSKLEFQDYLGINLCDECSLLLTNKKEIYG